MEFQVYARKLLNQIIRVISHIEFKLYNSKSPTGERKTKERCPMLQELRFNSNYGIFSQMELNRTLL